MFIALKRLALLTTLMGALWRGTWSPASAAAGQLAIDGTEFVLRLNDGRVVRGHDLVGAAFVLRHAGRESRIRIAAAERQATVRGEVMLYDLAVVGDAGSPASPVCEPDAQGRRLGFPLSDGQGGFALTCTSGAEGKCVLLGYHPWETGDIPMRDLFRACVHLIRADYGGDNRPTTRNGTRIDVYDRFGIQRPTTDAGMAFEAAWSPAGAVCVARPRVAETISLEEIGARVPRLAGRLGPAACNEGAMSRDPQVLLFNRSVP